MMMKPRLNLGMLLCMLSCLVAAGADGPNADEVKANEAKDKAPEQAGMDWAATAAMAGPGQHHEHLEPLVGTFDAKVKMRMGPGMPMIESTGVFKRTWILGGRQLREDYHSTTEGMPYQGLGFTGYDNAQKKYTSIWMDSMSTGTMVSTGTCDGKGKVFIYIGEAFNPITQQVERQKSVVRIASKDSHVFEMYGTAPDGKEFMSMEITCTRRATDARASSK